MNESLLALAQQDQSIVTPEMDETAQPEICGHKEEDLAME
jgi:hypothetical protein